MNLIEQQHVRAVLEEMEAFYEAEMVPEDDQIHAWILRLKLALGYD